MATDQPIYRLIARSTLTKVGAGLRNGTGSERCEWRINAPEWVTESGPCYLVLSRESDGSYTVAILRDGEGRSVETIALRERVADLDVDDVVLDLYYQRAEASRGS